MMGKTCVFTIVSNNYRHFARTLAASVRRWSPEVEVFVAICDDPLDASDPRDAFTTLNIRDLDLPKFDRFTFQYTILELNTAIKPWVFAALFARGYERVIYFDPDIKLYGPVDPVLQALDEAQVVLTPHLTGELDDGRHPSELSILQSGTYNLGFLALRQTDQTRQLVAWWQRKLKRECIVDIPRGLFTDQKWMDLVPGMFGSAAIVRDPGWNVAYWNLNHRDVTMSADGATLVNGQPLLFFHFSGFTPGARLLSKHQNRFTVDALLPAARALVEGYAADLEAAGIEECRVLPYAFARFADGTPIPDLVRRCYRESFDWEVPHPDLWTAQGQEFLLAWLNAPEPGHRDAPWFTRLAATVYRLRPDLQAAFPDAGGARGAGYARWFVENAGGQSGFPETLLAPVRDALRRGRAPARGAATPGRDTPLGATEGVAALGASDGGVFRSAFRSVYRTAWSARHLVKPLTSQRFRHTVRHWLLRHAYFDRRYTIPPLAVAPGAVADGLPRQQSRRPRAAFADARTKGVNVIGYLAAESGIGESARSMLRILAATDVPVAPIDFRVGNMSRMTETIAEEAVDEPRHGVSLFHINADQMFVVREHLGLQAFAGAYNIGYWAWELPEFPDEWVPALALLDEVWVPSAFCQQSIGMKSAVPVLRVPHSVDLNDTPADRAAFGLAADAVVFFTMCDVLSVPERKNPLAVVEAFLRAFPADDGVALVLKIGNLAHQPDLHARLQRQVAQDRRIVLLDGYLERAQLRTLMASVDCFVSLHRSEGFGLGMAEAMACGRVVIATGWSGNVDFTRADNALLVDYRLVALERDLGPYRRGQMWAEPDLESAVRHMREVAGSTELRTRLGARGRDTVARELVPAALAPMVSARLAAIDRRR